MIEGEMESPLAGWGNYPASRSTIMRPERVAGVGDIVRALPSGRSVIARGSGLAYGDAAVNTDGFVLSTGRLNKFLAFDPGLGIIRCQAGVPLGDILAVALPHGWFLAVTPGTSRATVGGCIACDVHGKNHHTAGSFGYHVRQITLLCADGEVLTCSPAERPELFWASVGGMGLTGIILDATLALRRVESSWVVGRNIVTHDLDDTFRVLAETQNATYSVAWIDATADAKDRGRGVVMLGEHAARGQVPSEASGDPLQFHPPRRARLPAGIPGMLRRPLVARLLNNVIFLRYTRSNDAERVVPASSFFYPLDVLENWNRLYGRPGFIEYQVIIPEDQAAPLIRGMLDTLAAARQPSFFTSMKRMGAKNKAPLSFPEQGIAFSFDVPVREGLFGLLDSFDDKIAEAGGRVYLAKDARCRSEVMDAFYPRRREWRDFVVERDPAGKLSSDLARRLRLRRD
jgi:FAD/FMN-containing dehydrogenase